MLRRTKKNLKSVEIGDSVNVFLSQFDQGREDPANLIGVVLEIKDDKYRVGTRGGIINQWLQRNSFEVTGCKDISPKDVPMSECSIRTLVRNISVGNGQGFKRCSCRKGCASKKCQCYKHGMICNCSCHSGTSCENL
jgi:hypothetical protein